MTYVTTIYHQDINPSPAVRAEHRLTKEYMFKSREIFLSYSYASWYTFTEEGRVKRVGMFSMSKLEAKLHCTFWVHCCAVRGFPACLWLHRSFQDILPTPNFHRLHRKCLDHLQHRRASITLTELIAPNCGGHTRGPWWIFAILVSKAMRIDADYRCDIPQMGGCLKP